ncbi:MAG: Na+/H+ antiporter NhaC family protein [Treponemataceae bacterium]
MFEFLQKEKNHFKGRRSLFVIIIVVAFTFLVTAFLPENPEDFGFIVCIPAIFLIVYIFATRRILEALTLSSIIGFMLISRVDLLKTFSETVLETMMSEDIAWLIIVCGLMGSIIALIEKTGATFAFGDWVSKYAKTRKSSLLWTWILGICVFIDDYLNSLTVASCMTPITDKHKVPREMLAYVVDSTAAPLCVLIPISTWAVFCSRILEANGWAPAGEGIMYFIKTIPYNFYGWIAALIVPLVIFGVIPPLGYMKKAEERVANGGELAPPGSSKIDIRGKKTEKNFKKKPSIYNFALPILVLIVSTIYFDVDMLIGVLFTMAFMFILYLSQNVMTAEDFTDTTLKGLKNMMLPLMLMVLAFIFAAMNEQIGFTEYVINAARPIMKPQLMPLIVFIILAITEFITGTNWGMYIIALPIVIPLATALNADMTLVVAAVLSAGVFGSHICFYSDATVITSAAAGCNNFDHALTQIPYGFIAAGISAVLFLIFGYLV